MKLENKIAMVTGAARGIGSSIAIELAREGANICIVDIVNEENANETMTKIKELGREAVYFKADVSVLTEVMASVDFVLKTFSRVDILVNNAGITRDNLILRMTEKDWDDVIRINLKSVFNYSKAIIKPMMSQRSGKIINISSVIGLMGNAGQANYAASKAGVIGVTKSLAKEFSSRNILVNAVAPGFIETDMTAKLNEQQRDAIKNLIPLKRIAKPEEVAKVVLFLASSDSDYITGQVIAVDGGMTM